MNTPARPLRLARLAWLAVLAGLATARAAAPAPAGDHRAFFDGLFRTMMEHEQIPGLAVVAVEGERTIFRAGYGSADPGRGQAVDVERTLFPLGSISKVMTTVAVLQLVERGAIDLDADVNRYIAPVRIDNRFPQPVTVGELLTHTDGFDVRWLFGGAARVPEKVRPLADLVADLPPRAVPPGRLYLYSDVGMTLAGYVVERVSGEPFAAYMQRHVFAPLGMMRTSFDPGREFYARDRATGYDYNRAGQLRAVPVTYAHAVPASGATAPIADLAPFLQALLAADAGGTSPVLGEHWVREMWRRQFTQNPALPGTSFGLYECLHHGHRALVHGGLVPGFTSFIMLLPRQRIGLCVVANRFDLVSAFEHDLLRQAIDHFAPEAGSSTLPAPPASPAVAPVREFDGLYRCDQYSRFSFDKLPVLAGLASEIRVQTQPDGRLRFLPDGSLWRPLGANVFQNEASGERIAFRGDDDGRAVRIVGSAQFMSYHRLSWIERREFHLVAGAVSLALIVIAGGTALWRTGRDAVAIPPVPVDERLWLRWLSMLLVAVVVVYFGALVFSLSRLDFATIGFGAPRALRLVAGAPILFALVALLELLLSVRAIRLDRTRWGEPATYIAASALALLLVPLLSYWNLLSAPFAGAA